MAEVEAEAPRPITLLIDGDVMAFVAASAVQHPLVDPQGFVSPFANIVEGETTLENMIYWLRTKLRADRMVFVLSDPESNWRKDLYADYKSNRKDTPRPLLLARLKEYLRVKYGAEHWPGMEADDVLSIHATFRGDDGEIAPPAKNIVVGRDKDFKSIPGFHYQWGHNGPDGSPIVEEISLEAADRWHLIQALAGDRIDGFEGCPGIGMERAARFIDDPQILVPERGVITRGPRKGVETVKWVGKPANGNVWGAIVSQYEKAGKTAADALLTARLARLLRWDEYDPNNGRITLWTPPSRITGQS